MDSCLVGRSSCWSSLQLLWLWACSLLCSAWKKPLLIISSSSSPRSCWDICRFSPARLSVPSGAELLSISTWQERKPGHGTLKHIYFFNSSHQKYLLLAPPTSVSPGSMNTQTWIVHVSKKLTQSKWACPSLDQDTMLTTEVKNSP